MLGDAFGEMLQVCWEAEGRPGVAYEVVERSDGFISVGDAARYFVPPPEWLPVEQAILERARGRVLDVGCGAGRHAVALTAASLEVVGIDPSPGAVAVTRARGAMAHIGTADNPAVLGRFDTILMMGNNLGLLASRTEAPAVLNTLASVSRPGARIYGRSHDPYQTRLPEHLAYQRWNRKNDRMPGQAKVRIRYRGLATAWFDYLLLSPEELVGLLHGTPWLLTDLIQDGADYTAELTLE